MKIEIELSVEKMFAQAQLVTIRYNLLNGNASRKELKPVFEGLEALMRQKTQVLAKNGFYEEGSEIITLIPAIGHSPREVIEKLRTVIKFTNGRFKMKN